MPSGALTQMVARTLGQRRLFQLALNGQGLPSQADLKLLRVDAGQRLADCVALAVVLDSVSGLGLADRLLAQ
jgi:hypothetical protein